MDYRLLCLESSDVCVEPSVFVVVVVVVVVFGSWRWVFDKKAFECSYEH